MSEGKAWELYDIAYYLFNTTYPEIKDPKLLLSTIDNIHRSLNTAMDAVIGNNSFTFRQKILKMQFKGLDTNGIEEVNDLIELHQKSPIEFSKDGSFVICNEDYTLKHITTKTIQELLAYTKNFLENYVERRKK